MTAAHAADSDDHDDFRDSNQPSSHDISDNRSSACALNGTNGACISGDSYMPNGQPKFTNGLANNGPMFLCNGQPSRNINGVNGKSHSNISRLSKTSLFEVSLSQPAQKPMQNGVSPAAAQKLQNQQTICNGSQHAAQNGIVPQQSKPKSDKAKPSGSSTDTRREFPTPGQAWRLRQAAAAVAVVAALLATRLVFSLVIWLCHPDNKAFLAQTWEAAIARKVELSTVPAAVAASVVAAAVWRWGPRRRRPVYLLDFALWTARDELRVSRKRFMEGSIACKLFSQESLDFQERIAERSGLGDDCPPSLPPALHILPEPIITMQAARNEAEMVMYEAVEKVLARTGLQPRDIGVLVVNCSLFCPTPSLSAMLVNRFKMRSDILSYNLGGMGCSAGIIAIGLAEKMLQVEGNSYALVVSTENITQNWYPGDDRSMLIPNTLFRMGASAALLTNKSSLRQKAKYHLERVVRIHLGADDSAYKCVYQHADEAGTLGVSLDRSLVKVAGAALQANLTKMGPAVLPASEKGLFVMNWLARRLMGGKSIKPYVPDFRRAFDHFCLHAGGRGVIEGLGAQLQLTDEQRAPSANTLYYYGNTSSSTVWYSLGFVESCQSVRKGDHVWQVGFGSGFKANSAVWRSLRPIQDCHDAWRSHPRATGTTGAAC